MIPTNAQFVLQGFADKSEVIARLAKAPPDLDCEGTIIALRVLSSHAPTPVVGLAEVVLAPTKNLPPGKRCVMVGRDDRKQIATALRNPLSQMARCRSTTLEWRTKVAPDVEPPRWKELPYVDPAYAVKANEVPPDSRTCGSGLFVRVDLLDDSNVSVVARIASLDKAGFSQLRVPVFDGHIALRGLCPRAFSGLGTGEHSVELTAVDSAGNEAPAAGPLVIVEQGDNGRANRIPGETRLVDYYEARPDAGVRRGVGGDGCNRLDGKEFQVNPGPGRTYGDVRWPFRIHLTFRAVGGANGGLGVLSTHGYDVLGTFHYSCSEGRFSFFAYGEERSSVLDARTMTFELMGEKYTVEKRDPDLPPSWP
jgi:hypothetical protein